MKRFGGVVPERSMRASTGSICLDANPSQALSIEGTIELSTSTVEGRKRWEIAGLASSALVNRKRFAIAPEAWPLAIARCKRKPKFYVEHNTDRVAVGRSTKLTATPEGLRVEGIVLDAATGQALEDELLDSFSVRFFPIDGASEMRNGVPTLTDVDLVEITLSGVPADTGAGIDFVQRLNAQLSAGTLPAAGGSKMNFLQMLVMTLKLAAGSTEEFVLSAIMSLNTAYLKLTVEMEALAKALNCEPDYQSIRLAIAASRSPENFVSLADHTALQLKLSTIERDARLAKYDGKIPAALLSIAQTLAVDPDPLKLDVFMSNLKTTAPGAALTGAQAAANTTGGTTMNSSRVTAEDRAWMEQLGVFKTEEELTKFADLTPTQALSLVFGDNFSLAPRKEDHAAMAMRRAREA